MPDIGKQRPLRDSTDKAVDTPPSRPASTAHGTGAPVRSGQHESTGSGESVKAAQHTGTSARASVKSGPRAGTGAGASVSAAQHEGKAGISPAAPEATGVVPRGTNRLWRWLVLAALIVLLDQVTKIWFDGNLQFGERWHILPFFDFTLLYNTGAAFSFLADGHGWQRWFFTAIAIGAVGLILHLLRRSVGEPLFCTALACILGGAVGNVIDRIQHGHVIDFLLFYWNTWFFPAFNIADVSITIGAILLVLDELLRMRRQRRNPSKG